MARCRSSDCEPEIVEEAHGIPIAGVDLIPQAAAIVASCEPREHEHGFAGSGRTLDPDSGRFARDAIQEREQLIAFEYCGQTGPRQLRKRSSGADRIFAGVTRHRGIIATVLAPATNPNP